MSDPISLILDASGLVVRVAVGVPADVPHGAGETVVARDGAAANTWIGWARQADGSWLNPNAPRLPTEDDLIAYAADRRWAILEHGSMTIGGLTLPTDTRTRGFVTAAALKAWRKPGHKINTFKLPDGTRVSLDSNTILAVFDIGEDRVQDLYERETVAKERIVSGVVTDTAGVDDVLVTMAREEIVAALGLDA